MDKALHFPAGHSTDAFPSSVRKITDSVRSQQQRRLDDPDQHRRFVELARELGADESPNAMDKAFERVVKPKDQEEPQKEG